jgi:hypothetical protein
VSGSFDGVDARTYVPSTLTGFRQWWLWSGEFRSLNRTNWPRGELTATCRLIKKQYVPKPIKFDPRAMTMTAAEVMDKGIEVEFEERRIGHPDDAPQKDCTCGIYCLHFPADWQLHTPVLRDDVMEPLVLVSGVVKTGGATVFGTLGFRTREAKIVAINIDAFSDPDGLIHSAMVARYPDIRVYRNAKAEMWADHPADDFSSLFDEETLERMDKEHQQFVARNMRLGHYVKPYRRNIV